MSYTVIFTPEAQEQILELYRYIATASSPEIAENYTSAVVTYCESLQTFPERGISRSDIRPHLRVTNYKKRTIIAFYVSDDVIAIIGIFYGGQDYSTSLQSNQDNDGY